MRSRCFGSLCTTIAVSFVLLHGAASYAAGQDEVQKIREELQRILKNYDRALLAQAFSAAGFTIRFPGTLGFRGMRYSEYEFQRGCWDRDQGPKAGMFKNDNCITYQSTCGGSKVTVTKSSGETETTVYHAGRMVFACANTIHLPPDEAPEFSP